MEWILYIIGGLILIGVFSALGVFKEIFSIIGLCLFGGVIIGIITWFLDYGFSKGWSIGIYVGAAFYIFYCILRIVNPETTIFYNDNYQETSRDNSRIGGIVGLIVMTIAVLISIFM